jgi:FixJ family two-component response regulator
MSVSVLAPGKQDFGVVHVVDDEESIREALASLLRSMGYEVRLYSSAPEFLAAEKPTRAGCILLDIRLPGISGLDLQSSLRSAGIELPVILMSAYGDIPITVRGMKAGALDFLTKPFRDIDVLDAVALAIATDRKRHDEAFPTHIYAGRVASLTPRERQVMALVLQGLQNKQIAYELDIKTVTVKLHRAGVMRKLEARSMLELVRIHDTLQARGEWRIAPPSPKAASSAQIAGESASGTRA